MGFKIKEESLATPQPKRTPFGPGIYQFTVTKPELKKSGESGNRFIRFCLLVDHAGFNYKLFDQIMFMDAEWAEKKYARVLQCLGVSPLEHPEQETDDQAYALADEIDGRTGVVRVRPEKDSEYCEPAHYFLPEEAENEELGAFPVKVTTAPVAVVATDENGEDIPF